ncbi:ricin-type beta-trefoil lectin domain protein [Streptomyces sp. NPDC051578]|uniref:ricin-type beta-trefoil lectin domain protein n=1 Tax=Streptomyces sp. NPDC051578 TaxID=3365662 RepID=UPI00379B87BA
MNNHKKAAAVAALAFSIACSTVPAHADAPSGNFQIRKLHETNRCVGWGDKQGHLRPVSNQPCWEKERTTWTYTADHRLVSDGECLEAWNVAGYLPILVTCEPGKATQEWNIRAETYGHTIRPAVADWLLLTWVARESSFLDLRTDFGQGDTWQRFDFLNAS